MKHAKCCNLYFEIHPWPLTFTVYKHSIHEGMNLHWLRCDPPGLGGFYPNWYLHVPNWLSKVTLQSNKNPHRPLTKQLCDVLVMLWRRYIRNWSDQLTLFVYIGDGNTTQFYRDYFIRHSKDPVMNHWASWNVTTGNSRPSGSISRDADDVHNLDR